MHREETATLGGGCFWCLEAVYDDMEGVLAVEFGYMGGHTAKPTYQQVCTDATGHAEVVQITLEELARTTRRA
ncbi:MAG: peptide-methionine (S)-S-oxide reductase [Acidobacteria bacterium]|nr:peptide-methionine (S)-S-oxide reductase [Acidobacteriota bacterium]